LTGICIHSVLEEELRLGTYHRNIFDRYIETFNNIKVIAWDPSSESESESILLDIGDLEKKYGYGESLCLVYCKYNHNVIASSNVKHIINFCVQNDIVYITTEDMLYKALQKGLMTFDECEEFIRTLIKQDSYLSIRSMDEYVPREIML